ncbi:MAG: cohesin domain-containing protein [Microgenomates group bacterium]
MEKKEIPIIFILGLILSIFIFWQIGSFLNKFFWVKTPSIQKNLFSFQEEKKSGKIELAIKKEETSEKNLSINLLIESNKYPIEGVDAIIKFDPKKISFQKISFNRNLFKQNILNQEKKDEGILLVTSYQPIEKVLGKNILANLTFSPLDKGTSKIEIIFNKQGERKDSNLVSQGEDILEKGFILNIEEF